MEVVSGAQGSSRQAAAQARQQGRQREGLPVGSSRRQAGAAAAAAAAHLGEQRGGKVAPPGDLRLLPACVGRGRAANASGRGVLRRPRWIGASRSHASQLRVHRNSPGAWRQAMQAAEGRRADAMAAGLVGGCAGGWGELLL